MTTIRIPLTEKRIEGVRCDVPLISLQVWTQFGGWVSLRFLIDSGADVSSISVAKAQEGGIPFERARRGTSAGLVGRTTHYRGMIRVKIAGRTHSWPCWFVETASEVGEATIPLLGRAGFRDAYDFCVDDEFLTITRRTPLRRWWRALGRWLTRPFVTIRTPQEPL